MRRPTPVQWHLYVVSLDPRVGTKPGKHRPCLAIQPSEFALAGLPSTVVLPLTTRTVPEHARPLRVRIPAGVCGLTKASDVLVDQILAWDNALFGRDLGEVPDAIQLEVKRSLAEFLDLD